MSVASPAGPRARRWRWLVLATLLLAAACVRPSTVQGELTVFAAASLRDVFSELRAAWETERPDVSLTIAYDGSNVLAAQIAQGAPADVYASADLAWPRRLVADGHARGEVVTFAHNRLVLVVPAGSRRVERVTDLAEPGVRIVAAAPGVPVTRYAEAAIAQLAATQPDPAAFVAALAANVVSREDNVRAALAKVELGEGDAAFVYATDAAASEAVERMELEGVDVVAAYGAVAVSDHPAALEFLDWLAGPSAAGLLERAGFEAVTP